MRKLQEANERVVDLFSQIESALQTNISISPIENQFNRNGQEVVGIYGFFTGGAVRVEFLGNSIIGVSVWKKPNDLNKPDYFVDFREVTDPRVQIQAIVYAARGFDESKKTKKKDKPLEEGTWNIPTPSQVKEIIEYLKQNPITDPEEFSGTFFEVLGDDDFWDHVADEEEHFEAEGETPDYARIVSDWYNKAFREKLIKESVKDDIQSFLSSAEVEGKSKSDLYREYFMWAQNSGTKPASQAYFGNVLKMLDLQGDMPSQRSATTGIKSPEKESMVVNQEEEDTFADEVIENEIYYKAAMTENILNRMAEGDPGIPALFLCGSPGLGKTFGVKKVFKEKGIWEDQVIYRSGSIAGFTGLLQLLWDNRKGRLIILDDNDTIFKSAAATNVLKAALNTDPEDRMVSYTKLKRGKK